LPIFRGFYSSLLFYWCIVGVAHALRYNRELEAERLKRAQAQAELVKAQLDVLKIQLNPHFLFNTLHSIAELMHHNIEAADRTITRLSEMLRMALSSSYAQMVCFDQELKLVDLYVGIQKTRFGDRIQFVQEIDERTHAVEVPSLILQPLIENAFVHGVGRNSKACQIVLRTEAENGHLHIEVMDDCDSKVPQNLVLGVGLGNVVNRVRQIYQGKASIDYGARPEGGFRVSIRFPIESQSSGANGSN
jgi:two-component system, LytTR family, sensor kinase